MGIAYPVQVPAGDRCLMVQKKAAVPTLKTTWLVGHYGREL